MNVPQIFLRIALIAMSYAVLLSVEAKPWKQLMDGTPLIRISNRGASAWQDYIFVDFVDNSVLVRSPNSQNSAEMIAFPVSHFVEGRSQIQLRRSKLLVAAIESLGNETLAEEGLDTLRPIVWPLVKALSIPQTQTNFHAILNTYLGALIRQSNSAEADAMVEYFNFKEITAEQAEMVIALIELLLMEDNSKMAFRHLSRLPLDEDRKDLQNVAMRFGKRLRTTGKFIDAVAIYERLFTLENSPFQQESVLWTAYCYLKADDIESANIYLSLTDDYDPRDKEFSLKCMIEGLISIREGNAIEAMHSISQGIVFSRLGLEWISELMLTSGRAYEAVGRPEVAGNVYRELIQFYPNDPFALEAKERLAQLPEPLATREGDASAG